MLQITHRKNITLPEHYWELYKRNETEIGKFFGSFSGFVQHYLEEFDDNPAEIKLRMVRKKIQELTEEEERLEKLVEVQQDESEPEDERKEFWDRCIDAIYNREEAPSERFSEYISSWRGRYRKEHHSIDKASFLKRFRQEAEKRGHDVEFL